MKLHTTYPDIAKLKQQPRHGRKPDDPKENPYDELSKLDLSDVISTVQALYDSLKKIPKLMNVVYDGLKNLNKGFMVSQGLGKYVGVVQELNQAYEQTIAPALHLENRNKALNVGFGINSKSAALLSQDLQKLANKYGITGEQAMQYAVTIKKMLPTMKQTKGTENAFYEGMQKTQQIMRENLGLTEDQAAAYTQYAAAQGGLNQTADATMSAAKAVADAMGDTNGDLGYFKMITEEIGGLSEHLQLQYGKIPGNLETAVIKAKKFGFALDDLAGASSHMLDIESSIGQELEYQLLTGRRLTDANGKSLTNTFREAALRGDMTAQADALNRIIQEEGETLENNVFARKQMADLLGMDEKKLASAIQKKKILDKAVEAGIEIKLDGSNALEAAAEAVKKGALTEEEFKKFAEETDTRTTEDLLKQLLKVQEEQLFIEQLTKQEQIISSVRKAAKAGVPQFSGMKITENELEVAGEAVTAYNFYDLIQSKLTSMVNAKPDQKNTAVRDVVIPPGNGRIISGDFGEFSIDNRDMILAGDPNKIAGGGGGNANIMQFAAMIVTAINNQTAALQRSNTFSAGINAPYYG